MIRTYDESVLAPVAGYVETRGDHRLRQQLDMLRVELYRMGFSDAVGGSSSGINKRAHVMEKDLFMKLISPVLILGKRRGYHRTGVGHSNNGDDGEGSSSNDESFSSNGLSDFSSSEIDSSFSLANALDGNQKDFLRKFMDRLNHSWFPFYFHQANIHHPTNLNSYNDVQNTIKYVLAFIQEIRTYADQGQKEQLELLEDYTKKLQKLRQNITRLFDSKPEIIEFVVSMLTEIFNVNMERPRSTGQLEDIFTNVSKNFEKLGHRIHIVGALDYFAVHGIIDKIIYNEGLLQTYIKVNKSTGSHKHEMLEAIFSSIQRNRYLEDDKYRNGREITENSYDAEINYPETVSYDWFKTKKEKGLVHFLMKFKKQLNDPGNSKEEFEDISYCVLGKNLLPTEKFTFKGFNDTFERILHIKYNTDSAYLTDDSEACSEEFSKVKYAFNAIVEDILNNRNLKFLSEDNFNAMIEIIGHFMELLLDIDPKNGEHVAGKRKYIKDQFDSTEWRTNIQEDYVFMALSEVVNAQNFLRNVYIA